jgi:hypothetical protein
MDQKKKYIEPVKKRPFELIPRFESIKILVESSKIMDKKEINCKLEKITDCMYQLNWRMKYLYEDHGFLNRIVIKSFHNLLKEIEWRIKEVESELKFDEVSFKEKIYHIRDNQ